MLLAMLNEENNTYTCLVQRAKTFGSSSFPPHFQNTTKKGEGGGISNLPQQLRLLLARANDNRYV